MFEGEALLVLYKEPQKWFQLFLEVSLSFRLRNLYMAHLIQVCSSAFHHTISMWISPVLIVVCFIYTKNVKRRKDQIGMETTKQAYKSSYI